MFFNSGIGIDIENHEVAITYLKGSFKGVKLVAESSYMLDESKPVEERLQEAAGFINQFIKDQKVTSAGIYIGIPGQQCVLREIELPMAVKENLRSTLEYEMEKYIPLPVEDVYLDFQIIGENKTDQSLKVLLAVIKKEYAGPYLRLSDLLDQGASGIEFSFSAISNYFMYHNGDTTDPAVVVDVKKYGFDIMYIHQGAMLYSRSVEHTDLQKEFETALTGHLTRIKNMFSKNNERLKLYVYGRKIDESFFRQLSEEFQVDISEHHPDGDGLSAAKFRRAVGLALHGIQKLPLQLNFMPVHLRKKPDKTSLIIMLILAVIFVASGSLWAGSYVMNQRMIMEMMDQKLAHLKTEAADINKLNADVKNLQDRIDYLSALRPANAGMADIVKELSERIPKTAYIKELILSDGQLSLYGIADSASDLIALLENSPIFSDVKFLSTIRKGRDDKEIFRIGLQIQKGQ